MSSARAPAAPTKRGLDEADVNKPAKKMPMSKPPVPTAPKRGAPSATSSVSAVAVASKEAEYALEIDQLKRDNDVKDAHLKDERDQNRKLRSQIIDSLNQIELANKAKAEAEKDKVGLSDMIKARELQLAQKDEALKAATLTINERTLEIQHMKEESQVVLADMTSTMESNLKEAELNLSKAMAASVARMETMTQQFEQQLQDKNEVIAQRDVRIAQIEADRDAKLAELQMQILTLKSDLSACMSNVSARDSLISKLQGNIQGREADLAQYQGVLSNKEREMAELLARGERERRKLLNTIEELRGNIRVYCRVRPNLHQAPPAQIDFPDRLDHREIMIRQSRDNATSTGRSEKPQMFKYDYVFGPESTQEDVFDQVKPLVESVLDGYKACIFAYGQTGSGKTHTMEGSDGPNLHGIIPRAIEQLFSTARTLTEEHKWAFNVTCTYLEIYNDIIRDLLTDSDEYHRAVCDGNDIKHEIRHEGKTDTYVTGVRSVTVTDPSMVADLLRTAAKNRCTARTKLNERSSRSHSVFTLKFEGMNALLGQKTLGVLCLIDLAGSERVADSGAISNQTRLKEAININQSLSHLGNVISALGDTSGKDGASHVPFRNCKLTYLLQNYLGGEGSKTLMFVNVSPQEEHVSETTNSLRFAAKVNSTVIGTAKRRVAQA